jgi:hypothetical protein
MKQPPFAERLIIWIQNLKSRHRLRYTEAENGEYPILNAERPTLNQKRDHWAASPCSSSKQNLYECRRISDRRNVWQPGHHAVVRPPIIAWRNGVR